jgi:hypothetical protein
MNKTLHTGDSTLWAISTIIHDPVMSTLMKKRCVHRNLAHNGHLVDAGEVVDGEYTGDAIALNVEDVVLTEEWVESIIALGGLD